jgi:hypothetical protein
MKDWSTSDGARELAARIRGYWLERGYDNVFTEVHMSGLSSCNRHRSVYGVTSNMKNGYPPRKVRRR